MERQKDSPMRSQPHTAPQHCSPRQEEKQKPHPKDKARVYDGETCCPVCRTSPWFFQDSKPDVAFGKTAVPPRRWPDNGEKLQLVTPHDSEDCGKVLS